MRITQKLFFTLMLTILAISLVASAWKPFDRTTWILEVFPIFIALPVLFVTYKSFPLTRFLYVWILLHALVLVMGGAYSYARVPFGFSLQEWFELSRNPYDKIGHFFQGFVPALVARELLVRKKIINGRKMLAFIIVCIVLAISASYELIEWAAALSLGQGADEFLGAQGDHWDTQSDMFTALIGAVTALLLFAKLHDKQLKNL